MYKRSTVPLVAVALFSMLILVTAPLAPYLPNVFAQFARVQPETAVSVPFVSPLSDPSYQISPQSIQNTFTYSDTVVDEDTKIPSDITVRIIPDVQYTVTEEDRKQADMIGQEVYNIKHSNNYSPEAIFETSDNKKDEDMFVFGMAYFVPYATLPPTDLERLKAEGFINPVSTTEEEEKEASIIFVQRRGTPGQPAPIPPAAPDSIVDGMILELAWKVAKKIVKDGWEKTADAWIIKGRHPEFDPRTIGKILGWLNAIRMGWLVAGYMNQISEAQNCVQKALADGRITQDTFDQLMQSGNLAGAHVSGVIAFGALVALGMSKGGAALAATGNPFAIAVGIGGPMLATGYAFSWSNDYLDNYLKKVLAPLLKYCAPKADAVLCKASYREVPYITRIGYDDNDDKIKPQLVQLQPTPPSEGQDTLLWGAPVPLPGETPAEYTKRTGIKAMYSHEYPNTGWCHPAHHENEVMVIIPSPDADVPEAASSTQIPQIGPGGSSSSNLQTGCTPGLKWNQVTGKCDLSAFSNLQTGCDPGFKFVNGKCEQLNLPDIPTTKEPKIITKPGGSGGESNKKPDINIDIKPPSEGSSGGSGGGGGDGGAN